MAIIDVKQVDNKFAMFKRQFQRIGQHFFRSRRADLFGYTAQAIDHLRKKQIERLLAQGLSKEEITEDMLGVAATWEFFCQYTQDRYSRRAFEGIIPALIDAKLVRRYYVECHRRKQDGREELEVVTDENGRPYLYMTIDEARAQRRSGGDIVNYFFLNADALNKLLDTIYELRIPSQPLPPTPGNGGDESSTGGESGNEQEKEGTQRGLSGDSAAESACENHVRKGNFRTVSSSQNISQPVQICEGINTQNIQKYRSFVSSGNKNRDSVCSQNTPATQNCTGGTRRSAREGAQNCEGNPRKSASNNKSNREKDIIVESNIISAPRAIDPLLLSQFDFSQPLTQKAVLQLSRLIYAPLPEKYQNDHDKEVAYAREANASEILARMTLAQEIGLRRLAATMAYHGDESSPCRYRAHCRRNNPGVQMRLYHLESETVLYKMWQEMEQSGWWPEYLPRSTGLVETAPIIDLAELAGIDASERIGMDANTTQIVESWLKNQLESYGYAFSHRRVGAARARGYCIDVSYPHEDGSQRTLRIYSFDQWELIEEVDGIAPIGTPEFVRHLSEVLRSQVAS